MKTLIVCNADMKRVVVRTGFEPVSFNSYPLNALPIPPPNYVLVFPSYHLTYYPMSFDLRFVQVSQTVVFRINVSIFIRIRCSQDRIRTYINQLLLIAFLLITSNQFRHLTVLLVFPSCQ